MVEQRIRNAWVGRSNLLTGTSFIDKKSRHIASAGFFACNGNFPLFFLCYRVYSAIRYLGLKDNIMKSNNTEKKPRVSVLMPVYKTPEKYLRETIESILNQTYRDFEFLILDDCPAQRVESVVKSYKDERIKYFQNEKNMGISLSRNKLLDLSQGEYLAVMDHDDISLSERFEKEVAYLDAHPEVGVVGTWYETFPNVKLKKRLVVNSQIEKELMYGCSVLHPSSMIRKAVLEKNHLRYEDEFTPAEDYALWCRLIGKTKFANIPEVLYRYRVYGENTSKVQADKMKSSSKKIHAFLEKEHPDLMRDSSQKQTLRFLGIPLVKSEDKGGVTKYKILNLIKVTKQKPVMTFDATNLPIYLVCNQFSKHLEKMIKQLEKFGLLNIHMIVNASADKALLKYVKNTTYEVHQINQSDGIKAFFELPEFKNVRENEYYVLGDSDVEMIDRCPADFMDYFYFLLQQYKGCYQVGFSVAKDAQSHKIKHAGLRLNWFAPYLYLTRQKSIFGMYRPIKDEERTHSRKALVVGFPYSVWK